MGPMIIMIQDNFERLQLPVVEGFLFKFEQVACYYAVMGWLCQQQ